MARDGQPLCPSCRYYDEQSRHYGICRRYAPRSRIAKHYDELHWPVVGVRDWCGEHMPVLDIEEIRRTMESISAMVSSVWPGGGNDE